MPADISITWQAPSRVITAQAGSRTLKTVPPWPLKPPLQGDTLLLHIDYPDLYSGGFNNVTLQFQRQGAVSQNTGENEYHTTDQSTLDPVLMGEWMRSQSMSGGGIAVVAQERLRISPGGTFLMYGNTVDIKMSFKVF
jgi:hypothetical protein